jgi:hypothetical protein
VTSDSSFGRYDATKTVQQIADLFGEAHRPLGADSIPIC